MSASELLERMKAEAGDGTMDWRRLREEIHDEFDAATTDQDRGILLAMFQAVMDNVERNSNLSPDQLAEFKEARRKDYNLFLVKESVIDESVCVELLDAATRREVAAGRMSPDHELRQLAVKGLAEEHFSKAEMVLNATVKHGRAVLARQRPAVEASNFDFMPQFLTQGTQLFIVGAMWRFGEKYDLPTACKERAFVALIKSLLEEGVPEKEAKATAASLYQLSGTADGNAHPLVAAGYEAGTTEGGLAQALGRFRNVPEVSGAPYRMLDRAKPISAILGVATAAVALLLGRGFFTAIGIGTVIGVASLAIALAVYRQMVKPK